MSKKKRGNKMSKSFKVGIFSCCDNIKTCLMSTLCTCYVIGKTADEVGYSCCICATLSLIPMVDVISLCQLRGTVRRTQDIDGNMLSDLCWTMFCPCCVVQQAAREVQAHIPGQPEIDRS